MSTHAIQLRELLNRVDSPDTKNLITEMNEDQLENFERTTQHQKIQLLKAQGGGTLHKQVLEDIAYRAAQAISEGRPIPAYTETEASSTRVDAEVQRELARLEAREQALRIKKERDQQEADALQVAIADRFPAFDWEAEWDVDKNEDWIIEPILAERRLVALYSPPKTGKSLLALEMAAAVAAGKDVLGTRAARPYTVLYVDFENDPHQDIIKRLKAMGYEPHELARLRYLSFPSMSALDSEAGSRELLAAAEHYGAEVIIIDTVSRAIEGDENENDTWLKFYRHTGLKLKQAGIACIRLDHSGKDVTKGQRGGSAKGGDVDAVWRLSTVTPDNVYQLDLEMNRMPIVERRIVLHRETSPQLRHRVDGAGAKAAFDEKVRRVIEAMDKDQLEPTAGRTAAAASKKKHGLAVGTSVLEEAVRLRKARVQATEQGTFDEA